MKIPGESDGVSFTARWYERRKPDGDGDEPMDIGGETVAFTLEKDAYDQFCSVNLFAGNVHPGFGDSQVSIDRSVYDILLSRARQRAEITRLRQAKQPKANAPALAAQARSRQRSVDAATGLKALWVLQSSLREGLRARRKAIVSTGAASSSSSSSASSS